MTDAQPEAVAWWREFFESVDSIPLSFFPDEGETERQVAGLTRLLGLRAGETLADICCGMGRHAIPLARAGLQVYGLDASAMMLRIARALGRGTRRLRLVRGDAARLPFRPESFDALVNLFNSFGYFADDGQNVAVLEEAARGLRPGGRFLLETRNRAYQILYAPYYQEVTLADGSPAIIRCRYDETRHQLFSTWADPKDLDRILYRARIRLYGLEELVGLCEDAGLAVEGVYSEYDGRPFEGWERMMIVHARKR